MEDLLKELKEKNVVIALDGSDLKVRFNGRLADGLLKRIKEHKSRLIEYLQEQNRPAGKPVIEPAPLQNGYPLSSSQLRFWMLSQFEEGNIAFNLQSTHVFEGKLNCEALEEAFRSLVSRHEILRTVFREDERGVRQYILPYEATGFKVQYMDLRHEKDRYERIEGLVGPVAAQPFDLAAGPLVRVCLYRMEDERWMFTHALHHIIMDGWSMELMTKELLLLYNVHNKGEKSTLEPLGIHYKDYAWWQRKQLEEGYFREHRNYWLERFSSGVPVLDISRKKRPATFSYKGNVCKFTIGREVAGSLVNLANRFNGTLYTSLLFIVKLLLYKYTRQGRIMVGTSLAGRDHLRLEDQIGLYINNLPLITEIAGELSLKEFYVRVKKTLFDALHHQDYPLDVLVSEIDYKMDKSRSGLFDVLVELHTDVVTGKPIGFDGFSVQPYKNKFSTANFDLAFEFNKQQDQVEGFIVYNTDLFDHGQIVLMKERLLRLLECILNDFDEDQKVRDIDFTIHEEKQKTGQLLQKFMLQENF
jgi:hypothetical protein